MWLLTCDGELFGGKRLWLRPGSTHLLGRTSGRTEGGEKIQYIEAKSVSRKHLIICVSPVGAGESAQLHSRSAIRVTDGSKMGTSINGDKITQESRVLEGKEFRIKLGNYEHEFQLRWFPVVISFPSLGKKSKAGGDPLRAQRESLEQADVKLVTEYVTNQTTHVVAKRRNTPPGLQALAQARWIVTDAFVDTLAAAVYKGDQEDSLLEKSFDENWPQEEKFSVPVGGEPVSRPAECLRPHQGRAEVFQSYTFVFLSQIQHELLLPVITSAGGKALLWEFHEGQSKAEDLIAYVRELDEHKRSAPSRHTPQPIKGGVVVVRLNGGEQGWAEFMKTVDIALDQRSIEQNEFLDAILTLDATALKRQLKEADDSLDPSSSRAPLATPSDSQTGQERQMQEQIPDTPLQNEPERPVNGTIESSQRDQEESSSVPQQNLQQNSAEQTTVATTRRARRLVTKSRFKGFEDFDPSQVLRAPSASPEPHPEPSQAATLQSMDVDDPQPSLTDEHAQRSLKRPHNPPEPNEEDMYENMLTGVAAMKRRKLEATAKGEKNTFAKGEPNRTSTLAAPKSKKKSKEIDVMATIQKRREAEEEQRRKDEETLREGLNGIDISDLKNLAKIEEMELPVRDPTSSRTRGNGRADRWDPAWNGRKNFKKFRPQGERRDGPRLQRVIVTLEEVPKRGHGMGDEYWLTPSTNRSKTKSQSQSQTIRHSSNRSQPVEEDETDTQRFRRRLEYSREEDADHAVAEDLLPEEVAGQARDGDISEMLGMAGQRKASGKRVATQESIGPPTKRSKPTRTAPAVREPIVVDDDDGDELRFRRRKR